MIELCTVSYLYYGAIRLIAGVVAVPHHCLVEVLVIVDTVARLNLNVATVVLTFHWALRIMCATCTHIVVLKPNSTLLDWIIRRLSSHWRLSYTY